MSIIRFKTSIRDAMDQAKHHLWAQGYLIFGQFAIRQNLNFIAKADIMLISCLNVSSKKFADIFTLS